jgi:hypothetical protein
LSTLAGSCVASCHAAASCPPVPPPFIAPRPLIAPLLCLLSGWLSRRLSSHCCLLSACASASHCTTTYYCAPLTPLVWLVVTSPLIMLPPPVSLCLRLSLHLLSGWLLHHLLSASLLVMLPPLVCLRLCLSLQPSCASCLAPCCITSHHANTAYRCLCFCLSLGCRLSSRPSCTSFLAGCCVTSSHASASRPPALCLSLHCRLSLCPFCASCLAGCHVDSCHTAASCQPAPLPLSALPPLIVPLLQSCVQCKAGNDQ